VTFDGLARRRELDEEKRKSGKKGSGPVIRWRKKARERLSPSQARFYNLPICGWIRTEFPTNFPFNF
jgi:hypothetical protein